MKYDDKPGREVIRAKLEEKGEGDDVELILHSELSGSGSDMVYALGIIAADYIHALCQQGPNQGPGLELAGFMADVQQQAAMVMAHKLQGGR